MKFYLVYIFKFLYFLFFFRLKSLIMCNNRISKIANFSDSMPSLENLILTNNRITDL